MSLSYTTETDPAEIESQPCDSGTWLVGTCGTCTSPFCGSPLGTCTQAVTCNGGCCNPDPYDPDTNPTGKPATTVTCIKPPYPDVWTALGDWSACSMICGTGTQAQTVTCSGSCCNPALYDPDTNPAGKPPETRSCVAGCCAADLVIGTDATGNPIFWSFPNTPDGDTASAGCPPG